MIRQIDDREHAARTALERRLNRPLEKEDWDMHKARLLAVRSLVENWRIAESRGEALSSKNDDE